MTRRRKKARPAGSGKPLLLPPARRNANPVALRKARGPFDVVGDVHGCLDELLALMQAMGYA